jgi:hypothetical protein
MGQCIIKLAQTYETFPVGKWNINSNCGDSMSRDYISPPWPGTEGPFTTDPSIFAVVPTSYHAGSLQFILLYTSRDVNMQDRGPQLSGVCGALLAMSIAAVGVRCYVRAFLTKSFGYDDWLIVATLVWPQCTRIALKSLTELRSGTSSSAWSS